MRVDDLTITANEGLESDAKPRGANPSVFSHSLWPRGFAPLSPSVGTRIRRHVRPVHEKDAIFNGGTIWRKRCLRILPKLRGAMVVL